MEIEVWWPQLDPTTQEWLIANNGDVVPAAVLDKISRAGGHVRSQRSRVGGDRPGGFVLSDTESDWIEEAANDEI